MFYAYQAIALMARFRFNCQLCTCIGVVIPVHITKRHTIWCWPTFRVCFSVASLLSTRTFYSTRFVPIQSNMISLALALTLVIIIIGAACKGFACMISYILIWKLTARLNGIVYNNPNVCSVYVIVLYLYSVCCLWLNRFRRHVGLE